MKPLFTMRQALEDNKLLGGVMAGDSWAAWRVLLIAVMGEPLLGSERALFTTLTGREIPPVTAIEEFWGIIGRRGGKSRFMAILAAYIAGLCRHDALVAGERGVVLCIAPDQRQAQIVLSYATAAFEQSKILSQLIKGTPGDTLSLSNGISLEVRASSFRNLRGPTYIAILADEAAFWRTEDSANPDSEILNAVRPGLATTGGPLIVASSPYARRGELYSAFRKHYGQEGDPLILVAKGPSRTFNPTLSQRVVDRAMARDAAHATAEYLAQFRTDIESYISREAVEAVTSRGILERPPLDNLKYHAFVDPSGGSSDSFTCAIAHAEGDRVVIDALRESKPPFSPESVVEEFSAVLKTYRVARIRGDRYAGEWPREQFKKRGITYLAAARPKSDLYLELLAPINSGNVDLLDHEKTNAQLCSLERRTARAGKDAIDHEPGGRDDLANVVAGVVHCVLSGLRNRHLVSTFGPVVFRDGRRIAGGTKFDPNPYPIPWDSPRPDPDHTATTPRVRLSRSLDQ